MAKGSASRDRSLNGATMPIAMADQWEHWALAGPGAKERVGFVNHFRLREQLRRIELWSNLVYGGWSCGGSAVLDDLDAVVEFHSLGHLGELPKAR